MSRRGGSSRVQKICFLLGVLATHVRFVNSPSCVLTIGTLLSICDASIKNLQKQDTQSAGPRPKYKYPTS